MPASILAQQWIEIGAKGLPETEEAIDSVKGKLDKTEEAANRAKTGIAALSGKMVHDIKNAGREADRLKEKLKQVGSVRPSFGISSIAKQITENPLAKSALKAITIPVRYVSEKFKAITSPLFKAITIPVRYVAQNLGSIARGPSMLFASMADAMKRLKGKMEMLGATGTKIFAAGAGFITLFTRAALEGTKEGERLSAAFSKAAKAIGSIFLPFVEKLTNGLSNLADWFNSLDSETKSTIATWILVGTAVAGFVAVLPTVVAAVGAVAMALAALASPFVLIPALIAGAVAAFLYFVAEGDTLQEKITDMVRYILDFGSIFKAVGKTVWQVMQNLASNLGESIAAIMVNFQNFGNWLGDNWFALLSDALYNAGQLFTNLWDNVKEIVETGADNVMSVVEWFGNNWKQFFIDLGNNTLQFFKNIGGMFSKFGQSIKSFFTGGEFEFNFSEEIANSFKEGMQKTTSELPPMLSPKLKALDDGMRRTTGKLPDWVKPQLKGLLDDVSGIWDQFTQELAEGNKETAQNFVGGIFGAIDKWKAMLDKLGKPPNLSTKPKDKEGSKLESLQGTWDRLQTSMNSSEDKGLREMKKTNQILGDMQANGVKIKDMEKGMGPLGA